MIQLPGNIVILQKLCDFTKITRFYKKFRDFTKIT